MPGAARPCPRLNPALTSAGRVVRSVPLFLTSLTPECRPASTEVARGSRVDGTDAYPTAKYEIKNVRDKHRAQVFAHDCHRWSMGVAPRSSQLGGELIGGSGGAER